MITASPQEIDISVGLGSRVLSRVHFPFNCAGFRCVFTRSFETKRCIFTHGSIFVPFFGNHCLIILSKILTADWLIALFSRIDDILAVVTLHTFYLGKFDL